MSESKSGGFDHFARWTERQAGSPSTFLIAVTVVIVWMVSGPLFAWSDTWQLVINTGTTIVTFLMVFLIQSTQSRDTRALHLKLDELIRVNKMARNSFFTLEELSEAEMDQVKEKFERITTSAEGVLPTVLNEKLSESKFPPHIETAIQSITQIQVAHQNNATLGQRVFASFTSLLTKAWFVGVLTAGIGGWVGWNLFPITITHAFDPPPFAWLEILLSLASLYMVVLIYSTQTRDDQLSQLREQLILELALLNEQKTAKVIALIEEFRRDIPIVDDRVDDQAEAMAEPADPEQVVAAIKETHTESDRARVS